MKRIQLTQGKYALVDDEDFARVNQFSWCTEWSRNTYYGKCSSVKIGRKTMTLRLHQFVMGYWGGSKKVDHWNGKGWDCRKQNLRILTESQNSANRAKAPGTSSKYKGVTWDKKQGRWRASLAKEHIGYFDSERRAAQAYDIWARIEYGDAARTNFEKVVICGIPCRVGRINASDRRRDRCPSAGGVSVQAVHGTGQGRGEAGRKGVGGVRR